MRFLLRFIQLYKLSAPKASGIKSSIFVISVFSPLDNIISASFSISSDSTCLHAPQGVTNFSPLDTIAIAFICFFLYPLEYAANIALLSAQLVSP